MRVLLLLLLTTLVGAPVHHGTYTDPNHYVGGSSFAGTRYIAEHPQHTLTMIGTDDGSEDWWIITGTCTGANMDQLDFDFSSKGGPSDLHGVAVDYPNGTSAIEWDDGNVWTHVASPAAFPSSAQRSRRQQTRRTPGGLQPADSL